VQISPWPREKEDTTQENMPHQISKAHAEFPFWVEHQSLPSSTMCSIPSILIENTKMAKSPMAIKPYSRFEANLQLSTTWWPSPMIKG
jgi:hypothetical protein